MCYFITLIAPTDNVVLVRSVMARHGRLAEPIDNPSVRKILKNGERQYFTTPGQCDCGTVLAARVDTSVSIDETRAKQAAQMRRKGWSEAKIARALDGQRQAHIRPHGGGSDSLELWNKVLSDLSRELKLPTAGLLVRFYTGAPTTEAFSASRREIPKSTAWHDELASMKDDELTIFRLS
jgi:hypothetical protein